MLVLTAVVIGSICLGLGLGVLFTKLAGRSVSAHEPSTAEPAAPPQRDYALT